MHHVLLAADGNTSRVLEQAEAIAALPHASTSVKAYVLHVFSDTAAEDDSDMLNPNRVQAVSEAEEFLTDRGIDTEVVARAGDIVSTVLQAADEFDADALYVGGPKRSPAGKAIFGSVTQELILNSEVPVTVTIDR